MSSARLHGADHREVGEIASVSEGSAAIALSRGGARKRYAHRDPNEDMVGFACSEWGAVLAVADGHAGCEAARVCIDRVLDTHAARWLVAAPIDLDTRFASEASEVAFDLNQAILREAGAGPGGGMGSRTTLALALLRPRDRLLAALSIGDSHVFGVDTARSRELVPIGETPPTYLGEPAHTRERLESGVRVELASTDALRAVVLATDGLSERGIGVEDPGAAVAESVRQAGDAEPALRALHAARGVMQRAMQAHAERRSGDNVACAVLWLE